MVKSKTKKIDNLKQRVFIALVSVVGFAIMSYLTYIHFSKATSFCNISETVSCDVVTTSIYSEVFGIPLSILGMLYFAFVLLLILTKKGVKVFENIFFITLLVLFPSFYLTLTEALVIKSYCILCETSKVLMLIILVTTFLTQKKKLSEILRLSVPIILAGIVLAAVTFFAQTGNTTREDYSVFVENLNAKGVVYYKSVKCSNCKRQERLLGKAYTKLNSVECHPEGPNPQVDRCLQMKISKTPTFIIEQNGVELKRIEGLQKLENLAKWAEVEFERK